VAILSNTCAPSFSDNLFYCRHNIIPLFSIATSILATFFASRIHIAIPDEKIENWKIGEENYIWNVERCLPITTLAKAVVYSFRIRLKVFFNSTASPRKLCDPYKISFDSSNKRCSQCCIFLRLYVHNYVHN